MQLTLKGTPFIFQGDEMGLGNYDFTSMDQITDVEAKGFYAEHIEKKSHEEVFNTILAGTREHCRVLLPWNNKFPEYHKGLVQEISEEVQGFYKKIIEIRQSDKTFIYGSFDVLDKKKNRFVYKRELNGKAYIIDCNLDKKETVAYAMPSGYKCILDTKVGDMNKLSSYQARIWKKEM